MKTKVDYIKIKKQEIDNRIYSKANLCISFIGSPGSDKRKIALMLSKKLNIYVYIDDLVIKVDDAIVKISSLFLTKQYKRFMIKT